LKARLRAFRSRVEGLKPSLFERLAKMLGLA